MMAGKAIAPPSMHRTARDVARQLLTLLTGSRRIRVTKAVSSFVIIQYSLQSSKP